MPLPSLLARLFHDGCYSVRTATRSRLLPTGTDCPPCESARHRLAQALTEIRQTVSLSEPSTRQGRALLMDEERALAALVQPCPDPRAWRKLPSPEDVEQWMAMARFDPRIRPDLLDALHQDGRALRSALSTHGVPSNARIHRNIDRLIADVELARRPGPPIALRLSRELHERRDVLDAELTRFLCHRGELMQARADMEPMNAALRHVEWLLPEESREVHRLRRDQAKLRTALDLAARQLGGADERALRTAMKGMTVPRMRLRERLDALGGACATRYRPRVTPESWERTMPRPTPSPAPD